MARKWMDSDSALCSTREVIFDSVTALANAPQSLQIAIYPMPLHIRMLASNIQTALRWTLLEDIMFMKEP